MFDPSDAAGFADRLFPVRLNEVVADEDGIWHYGWVEMMLGPDGLLVEHPEGRVCELTLEEFDYEIPPDSGNIVTGERAIDPSDGAAIEVNNSFVPISIIEDDQPIVWLKFRGMKGGDPARYEFRWDQTCRMVYCSGPKYASVESGLEDQFNPGYYPGRIQYLDPTTGGWLGASDVLIKAADYKCVIQESLRHLATPTGYVTTENDGEPGMSVWLATGNTAEVVYRTSDPDDPSGLLPGQVSATGEVCWISSLRGDVSVGQHIGIAHGTYQAAGQWPKPIYAVAPYHGSVFVDGFETGVINTDNETGIYSTNSTAGAVLHLSPAGIGAWGVVTDEGQEFEGTKTFAEQVYVRTNLGGSPAWLTGEWLQTNGGSAVMNGPLLVTALLATGSSHGGASHTGISITNGTVSIYRGFWDGFSSTRDISASYNVDLRVQGNYCVDYWDGAGWQGATGATGTIGVGATCRGGIVTGAGTAPSGFTGTVP